MVNRPMRKDELDETFVERGPFQPPSPGVGMIIGHCRLERLLGRGSMGIVYVAEHTNLKQRYALKILAPEWSGNGAFRRRFMEEGSRLAALDHPHIVRIHDAGEDQGYLYLVMDLLGSDLGSWMQAHDVKSPGRSISVVRDLLRQMLEAMAYAHGRGLVHRDLKPSNLLLSPPERSGGSFVLKVGDFGLAVLVGADTPCKGDRSMKATADLSDEVTLVEAKGSYSGDKGELIGTIDFMAPEVRAGGAATVRSDLYSAGVTAYLLLTGRKPLGKYEAPSVLVPDIPPAWDRWVDALLAADPQKRVFDASAALESLRSLPGKGSPPEGRRAVSAIWKGGVFAHAPGVDPPGKFSAGSADEGMASQNGNRGPVPSANAGAVRAVLKDLRHRLLDLTLRNPLLHFSHGYSKRHIRLLDEVPHLVLSSLQEGKAMVFRPLTKSEAPPAKGRAPRLDPLALAAKEGFAGDWELPAETRTGARRRHRANTLQTPYFPEELESRLANMAKLSRTAVEESGVNLLYLVLGFLEWYAPDDPEKALHAPLFFIPVRLEKGRLQKATRTYEYELVATGEDPPLNDSLAARLLQDFGYEMPLSAGRGGGQSAPAPEAFFRRIERSVRARFPRWRVRRFGTLTFLNFSNLLMHRDLDPSKWTGTARIDQMPLVGEVVSGFLSAKEGAMVQAASHRSKQAPPSASNDLAFVESADDSQVSAVVDALRLGSLVIEGPPGTGKSQTITNLIACALHRGKSVLFISEKMAALEVVRARLDRVGLAPFCLELHGSSTRKLNVAESLGKRLKRLRKKPRREWPDWSGQQTETAQRLDSHAAAVNAPWAETGWSVYQILTGCARLRMELAEELHPVQSEPLVSADADPSAHKRRSILRDLTAFHEMVAQIRERYGGGAVMETHPWRGVGALKDAAAKQAPVCEALRAWTEALETVSRHLVQLNGGRDSALFEWHLSSLGELPETWRQLAEGSDKVWWGILPWATSDEGQARLRELLTEFERLRTVAESTEAPIDLASLPSLGAAEAAEALSEALAGGLRPDKRLIDVARLHDRMREAVSFLADTSGYLHEFSKVYGIPLPAGLDGRSLTLEAVQWLRELTGLLQELPEAVATQIEAGCLEDGPFASYDTLAREADALEGVERELAETLILRDLPPASTLRALADNLAKGRSLFAWLRPGLWRAWRDWRRIRQPACRESGLDFAAERLRHAADFLERRAAFAVKWQELPFVAGAGGGTAAADALALRRAGEWHSWMRDRNSLREGALFGSLALTGRGSWLTSLPGDTLRQLRALSRVRFDERAEAFALTLAEAAEALVDGKGEGLSTDPLPGEGDTAFLQLLGRSQRVGALCGARGWEETWRLVDVFRRAGLLATAHRDFTRWISDVAGLGHQAGLLGERSIAENPHGAADSLRATLSTAEALRNLGARHPTVVHLCRAPGLDTFSALLAWSEQLREKLAEAARLQDVFVGMAAANISAWRSGCSQLAGLIARNQAALSATALFGEFQSFLRSQNRLRRKGFAWLPKELSRQAYSRDEVRAAGLLAFCTLHARRIFAARPEFRDFEAAAHNEWRQEFAEADTGALGANARRVRDALHRRALEAPEGHRGTRVGDLTEMALLKHEVNKQRAHIPIRHLLKRAGKTVQALMPCFMMSPKSVAQYLDSDGLRFDLLVIDEASQMKPAEAMGAVARCSGMVVVGDPRQMPPTSFFDRISFDSSVDEDERFTYAGAESLLDAVMPVFPVRRLLWHYRSRDPALIAFSNTHFYDRDLLLFPAPFRESTSHGLRFHKVDTGLFSGGANPLEAKAVARRVGEILCRDPQTSLGVAAMSLRQRDLIDRFIEEYAKDDPAFEEALARNRESPDELFVKNLESVQGDERDIILISCTYGPESPGGPVPLRFGPILAADGWRRLNVLFTRARVRMEVFASMEAADIRPKKTAGRGLHAFRDFLAYAAHGAGAAHAHAANRLLPNDDFQRTVVALLENEGYVCDCGVGLSECLVDVAVRDPADPRRYLLGLDSDGPAYSAVARTRDRDLLKHRILSLLGWNMHTVWAPDFHRDPVAALAPVLEKLRGTSV